MAKAFSEEDRILIQDKLRRVGLRLFASRGIKGVSIREITSEAGISQGGFYNFYKDKEEFMIDLMELRIKEKLGRYESDKESSLDDPIKFLSDILYLEGMHLKDHKAFSNGLSGSLKFFYDEEKKMNRSLSIYYEKFLKNIALFWEKEGYKVEINIAGIMSVIRMAGVIFSNSSLVREEDFSSIYRAFCDCSLKPFLKVSR